MLLTNDVIRELDRVRALYRCYSILKLVYVVGMICFCAYFSYYEIYDQWVYEIVSMILTANVIWVFFDLFYNPVSYLIRIINGNKKTKFKL